MNPVVYPWLAEILIISYRSMSGTSFSIQSGGSANPMNMKVVKVAGGNKRPPLPSELIATFVAFGVFSIPGGSSNPSTRRIGSLLGWGTFIATALLLFNGGTAPASQTGTFPAGQFPKGGLTQPLPNLPNHP